MSYKNQLQILLWKNVMIRKRQKNRCMIEFVWPLFLCLVLVFVRLKGLMTELPSCYFDPKAMPSAGILSFLQGFICAYNNTCHDEVVAADGAGLSQNFQNSMVSKMGKDAERNLYRRIPSGTAPLTNTDDIWQDFIKGDFVKKNRKVRQDSSGIQRENKVGQDLMNTVEKDGNFALEMLVRNAWELNYFDDLPTPTQASKKHNDTMDLILKFLCGKDIHHFKEKPRDSHEGTSQYVVKNKYKYDNTTTPFCNAEMKKAETDVSSRMLWLKVKPFVRGKILYSPDMPVIRELMVHANKTFKLIADLKVPINLELAKLTQTYSLIEYTCHNLDNNISIVNIIKKHFSDDLLNYTVCLELFNANQVKESMVALQGATKYLECLDLNKFEGFATEIEAVNRSQVLSEDYKLWSVISFLNIKDGHTLPPYIRYKIRIESSRVDGTGQVKNWLITPRPRREPLIDLKYFTSGFIYIQDMIDQGISEMHTGTNKTPGMILQQFPSQCYIVDDFIDNVAADLPLLMVLSWVYSCAIVVRSIVHEKEQRLKETLHTMGLDNPVHWLGWFIDCFVVMFLTSVFLTVMLVYGKIVKNSDPGVVLLLFTCYTLATIMFSFLLSTFFSKANLSAAAGGMIYFLLYLPHPVATLYEMTFNEKMFLCLSSNVAFSYGFAYIAYFERVGNGMHWNDVWDTPVRFDDFQMGTCIMMLVVDAVIYGILTWYIETAFPGEYGIPEPWYFPVQISYWRGKKFKSEVEPDVTENVRVSSKNFEEEPTNLPIGVSIHNLRKVYSNGKVAVDNLSLNFYEDQITSFLGENGAGKTTTMSIITGLFAPTQGTVKIQGVDICEDSRVIRKYIGVCPQYNILFNDLTVKEHLWFYAQLKDTVLDDIELEIDILLRDLELRNKRHELSKNLSGGMKRKLSIGCAFIGGSKVVVLDEPTAGIDPHARRSIWDLLLKYKQGHTIILTTHHMDEADILGDRIAIIESGRLVCCGTSLFMKKRFGSGYYLTVLKKEDEDEEIEEDEDEVVEDVKETDMKFYSASRRISLVHGHSVVPDSATLKVSSDMTAWRISAKEKRITHFIQGIFPDAKLIDYIGSELTYVLPVKNDQFESFQNLFSALDAEKDNLEINSYGVSDTPLEEIFLKAIEEQPVDTGDTGPTSKKTSLRVYLPFRKPKVPQMIASRSHRSLVSFHSYLDTRKLRWRHVIALWIKRFHRVKRNKKALFNEVVLPPIFVCFCIFMTKKVPKESEQQPLIINPWNYERQYVFFSNANSTRNLSRGFEESFIGPIGFGTKCITNPSTCNPVNTSGLKKPIDKDSIEEAENHPCLCPAGVMVCPPESMGPVPPQTQGATGDILRNLTGRSISDWLLKTYDDYNRFGGYTFGVTDNLKLIPIGKKPIPTPALLNELEITLYNNIKVWFNNIGWTSSVGYLNGATNLVLRYFLPEDKDEHKYGIEVISHPISNPRDFLIEAIWVDMFVALLHSITVVFALSFVSASFAVIPVDERSSQSKHLQFVAGVTPKVYWLSTIFWDMGSYMVTVLLLIISFTIVNEKDYIAPRNFPGLLVLLILYGWASIPLMYSATFMFSVSSTAFVVLGCTNLFVAVGSTLSVSLLENFKDEEMHDVADVLRELLMVFPHFCLGYGLLRLAKKYYQAEGYAIAGVEVTYDCFGWDVIGKNIFFMAVEGFVFFSLCLAIEYKVFSKYFRKADIIILATDVRDEDVLEEKKRVLKGDTSKDILILRNLTKIYSKQVIPAVNQACVGVRRGHCFGLLGVNGAGKTTTFKMITGEISPTFGDAVVEGHSISTELRKAGENIGYCPQFDALDYFLTPREHLTYYARIRGLQTHEVAEVVPECLSNLGLGQFADKSAGTLSGGNRRKLSTAIALIGHPPLILLDEPTSGMDPKARRFLWTCILKMLYQGWSVVLTSHSMEECENLCTRLTIMVNGEFKCLGSVQHLKNKFGGGYVLMINADPQNMKNARNYIVENFPGAVFQEACHNQMKYMVPLSSVQLSNIFRVMSEGCRQGVIEDFSVNQVTLEDTFLKIVSDQIQPTF